MNSQLFLFLNIFILFLFVVWFFAGRRSSHKRPTSLNMKRGNQSEGGVLQKTNEPVATQGRYSHPKYRKFLEDAEFQKVTPSPKELNVLFNYNGHTWDAYEVFGLPAGTSLVEVTQSYQEMLRKAEPESHEFLETAFKTILSKK